MENTQVEANTSPELNGNHKTNNNNKKKQLTRSDALATDESSAGYSSRGRRAFNLARLSNHGSLDNHKDDFTDDNGIDLLQFIVATLHKNRNDRDTMLKLEEQMRDFIQNPNLRALRFPRMCSYNRMLVHRVAAFFHLDHNVDNTASQVICTRTPRTILPTVRFASLITSNTFTDDVQRGNRSTRSFDEGPRPQQMVNRRPPRNNGQDMMRRTKSVEVDSYQRYYVFDNRAGSAYSSSGQLSNPTTPTISSVPLAQSFRTLSIGEQRMMDNVLKESPNESQATEEIIDDTVSFPTASPFVPLDESQATPQYMYPVYDVANIQAGIPSCSAAGYVYVYDTNTQVFVAQPNIDPVSTQLCVLSPQGPVMFPQPGMPVYSYPYSTNIYANMYPYAIPQPQVLPVLVPYYYGPGQIDSTGAGPSSINASEIQSKTAE
uniref:R3H domain-containing protein n=1 Tax=Panagrolaimus sp. JU765 TaxID=591449 RepID=A0AC34RED6_9BILA